VRLNLRGAPVWPAIEVVIATVVGAVLVAPRLFGVGPSAIHDLSVLAPTITVCDRQYHGGASLLSRAEIQALGIEPVLVDPAPLARCAGHDAGARPCTRDPNAGACSTVVFVRVAEDAYAEYALVGGP